VKDNITDLKADNRTLNKLSKQFAKENRALRHELLVSKYTIKSIAKQIACTFRLGEDDVKNVIEKQTRKINKKFNKT